MEIIKYIAPFDCDEVISLWKSIFGEEEALLEKPQLDGSESLYNKDIVFVAKENDDILGAIHITIPNNHQKLCGLSGMCTKNEARGKGVGEKLFKKAVEEISQYNIKVSFLGTSNPIAAKLYHKFDFSFISGSFVMAKFMEKDYVDFDVNYYNKINDSFDIKEGSSDIRIPIIPLVLNINNFIMYDCNTEIFARNFMAENSCMGLFPRYLKLKKDGGNYFCAYSNGILVAIISIVKTLRGYRTDFFCAKNFEYLIPNLVRTCEKKYNRIYFQVYEQDSRKIQIIEELGYKEIKKELFSVANIILKTIIFEK